MALNMLSDAYCSESEDSAEDTIGDSSSADLKRSSKKKLHLPQAINELFQKNDCMKNDNVAHKGRIRSFAHERGNWATYIFVPYPSNVVFDLKQHVIHAISAVQADDLEWNPVDNFHLSVSKTVVIPHHFIEPMVQALHERLIKLPTFDLVLSASDLKMFVNDEKTRSFCAIEVSDASVIELLSDVVDHVDGVFQEYRCDTYYTNPSYHISIAWCLGDITKHYDCNSMLTQMMQYWNMVESDSPELFNFTVSDIVCKTGNKIFSFKLAPTF